MNELRALGYGTALTINPSDPVSFAHLKAREHTGPYGKEILLADYYRSTNPALWKMGSMFLTTKESVMPQVHSGQPLIVDYSTSPTVRVNTASGKVIDFSHLSYIDVRYMSASYLPRILNTTGQAYPNTAAYCNESPFSHLEWWPGPSSAGGYGLGEVWRLLKQDEGLVPRVPKFPHSGYADFYNLIGPL